MDKSRIQNIIFISLIALLLIPQTRKSIAVFVQRGVSLFSPAVKDKAERVQIDDYRWSLITLDRNHIDFQNARGRVALISFWATWCPPCIAEMPQLQSLYDDYKDKMEFYFVSHEEPETIQAFLNKNQYSIPVQIPQSAYPPAFDVSSIPRTFLIDQNGYIVIDKTGAANWNSDYVRETINGLLAQ